MFVQVLEECGQTIGFEHPHPLVAMGDLAGVHCSLRNHREAQTLYLRVLETSKRILGDEHPDSAGYATQPRPTGFRSS